MSWGDIAERAGFAEARTDDDLERAAHRALELFYGEGKPPWDTGVSPPELVSLVEGPDAPAPGRALELGCGTGTNAVYLARRGWDVVAVDFVEEAVRQAREKAEAAGTAVRVLHGDATRLDEAGVTGRYDLFFDLSCFCGIPHHRRDAYAEGLTRHAAAGALLLMFGYGPGVFEDDFSGVTADELRTRFAGWEIVDVTPGTNPFPTSWFTLRYDATRA